MGRFFRLVVAEMHPRSGQLAGVFSAAYRLRDEAVLPEAERDALEDLLGWFARHLPAPRLTRDAAICWFRGTGNACTRRFWDLV
jgi:hypothetical protein